MPTAQSVFDTHALRSPQTQTMSMSLHLVLLLFFQLLFPPVHLSAGQECPEESLQEMQTQFKNCATGLGYQFEDTRNTFRGKEYVQVENSGEALEFYS